ncbi:phage major tail tube protein [Limnobaculum xujianqingii]|uniref:phage major tail tube protein n=1 Tax=Limnobaculum xujianqingii TaxID=2738837 RepID=UPI00112D93EA|nr:phage major tail tube protein [Limnobaculum xujianqingii]
MALPRKFKYFNGFVNGDNYMGLIPEVELPKLSKKVEDYQAGGMPGAIAVDLGFDSGALDMGITLGGVEARLLKTWGNATADGTQFRFAGSIQDEATGEAVACEIQTRGRFTELDPGSAKAGDDTSQKYTLKNTYLKLTIAGEEIIEVDLLNMIYVVGGVDVLEKHRANCGL